MPDSTSHTTQPRQWQTVAQVVPAVALVIMALIRWWGESQRSGWFGDDAWVVASVRNADSVREFLDLGFTHPGFNALAKVAEWLGAELFGFRVLAAGAALASLVVIHRLVLTLTGSALLAFVAGWPVVASWLHFRFAIAVKPYTLEALAMAAALLLATRIDRLAPRHFWRWTALILPLTLLSFRLVFVSVALAAGLWFTRRISHRQLIGLGLVHVALCVPWLLYLRTLSDQAWVADWWRDRESAFPDSIGSVPADLPERLGRVTRVLLDGPGIVAACLVLASVAGGVLAVARRHPAGCVAVTALLLSIVANLAGLVPFGPRSLEGERIDLWLTPAFITLLSIVAVEIRTRSATLFRTPAVDTRAIAAAAVLAAVFGIAVAATSDPLRYPVRGSEPALALALSEADRLGVPIIGDYEASYHLAALFPDVIERVDVDRSHPRGIEITPDRDVFITAEAFAHELAPDVSGGAVVSLINLRGPQLIAVYEILDSVGLEPARQPFERVAIWLPAGGSG